MLYRLRASDNPSCISFVKIYLYPMFERAVAVEILLQPLAAVRPMHVFP